VLADEPTGNLDSATGAGVVDLLTSLSEQRGHTVILVTHDNDIAEKAHRSIRMKDGRLLEPDLMSEAR
jgi:ABC-type lipoprotein export system ATPase subunit